MKSFVKIIFFACALFLFLPQGGHCKSRAGARFKDYITYALLPHLWDGTKNTFAKPENWIYLGAGAGAAAIAYQYDDQVNEYWQEHRLMYSLDEFGNDLWGMGEFQAGLALSMMFAGWHMEDEELAATGEVLAEAQIIQGVVVNVIKPIAGRERPSGENNLSFPSGHTSTAFCTAAVLHHRKGWAAGLPAYAFAVITAMSRMDVQAHYLSDTVMGATIAMVTGYAVSMHHDDYPYEVRWKKGPGLVMAPVVGDGEYGINLSARW